MSEERDWDRVPTYGYCPHAPDGIHLRATVDGDWVRWQDFAALKMAHLRLREALEEER